MKIVISGYGRMGHEVERTALERGHEIVARPNQAEDWESMAGDIIRGDMAIEFSTPASAVGNIRRCFDLGLPVVAGTTGWNQEAGLVREWCLKEKKSLFTAANFNIGVNILFSVTRHLSAYLDRFDSYDVSLEEIHHKHKLDAPSGTAIRLAEIILQETGRKKSWVNRPAQSAEELEIMSRRSGEVPGTHIIRYSSENDLITLTHEARSRKGFATGAVMAAEWLAGKTGYYTMDDFLGFQQK